MTKFLIILSIIVLVSMVLLLLVVALESLTYMLREDHWFVKWWRKNIISHEDLEP